MIRLRMLSVLLVGCALLLALGIPFQQSWAAPRTVLMELMTATWCPYCPSAEDASYSLADQYGPSQVALIEYHTTSGDPFGTPETYGRFQYYAIPGTPTMEFDGWEDVVGGGVPMIPYYEPIIISHLQDDASMTMSNTGSIGASSGEATVHIEVEWVEFSPVKLRFALIEHGLVWDDTYNYVCRDLLPEETLTITSPGQTFDVTRTFTVSSSWNYQNMDIVTFVQYDGNKHVLQSCMGFDFPAGDVTVTLTPYGTPIVIPANGGSFNFNVAVANNELTPWSFDVWTDATLPSGAAYGPIIGPLDLTLAASSSLNRDRTQSVPGAAPAGTYSYNAYVGNYPDDVWSTDSFTFQKSITGDGGAFVNDWFSDGQSLSNELIGAPAAFTLEQNYPNPFNPETTIGFDLPEAASVTLAVYDVNGRQVATLVNGFRGTGHHQVTWDASAYAAGVYIYRLSAGSQSASGKMVLMK